MLNMDIFTHCYINHIILSSLDYCDDTRVTLMDWVEVLEGDEGTKVVMQTEIKTAHIMKASADREEIKRLIEGYRAESKPKL